MVDSNIVFSRRHEAHISDSRFLDTASLVVLAWKTGLGGRYPAVGSRTHLILS